MDCRKWILVGMVLMLAGSGCAWQELTSNPFSTQTTQNTPPVVPKNAPQEECKKKKTPKASTCVLAGEYYLKESTREDLNKLQREETLESSRRAFQQSLDIEKHNLEAFVGLAKVYTELKDYPRALETYKTALELYPNEMMLWRDLAWCHGRQKNFNKAADCCKRALDIEPENRTCATTLGLFLARAGKTEQSIAILTPIHGKAQANMYVAKMMNHMGKAEEANRYSQVAYRMQQGQEISDPSQGVQHAIHQVPATLPESEPARPANLGFQR